MTTGSAPQGGHNRLRGDLFGSQAENYDQFRPAYPTQLFQLLAREAKLTPESHVLEIGAGSGFATVPMAERGLSLVALEPSPELAGMTRRRLSGFPKAEVLTEKFEDADLPDESFDLVYGATSVHWVDPEVLFQKSHRLLKNGGLLAFVYNELVETTEDMPFFDAFEPIVIRYGVTSVLRAGTTPETAQTDGGTMVKNVAGLRRKHIDRALFQDAGFAVTDPPVAYSYGTQEYLGYLQTLSSVLSLPEPDREAFLAEVRTMVDALFAGKVTLHFSATTQLAKKKTPRTEESGAPEKP